MNSETTYSSTTGWSIGFSGGSKAEEVQRTIEDFKFLNISDVSMSGWICYYTAMDGRNWVKHYQKRNTYTAVKPIADLARGTLTLNAECVYRGPANSNDKMDWTILFKPTFALMRTKNMRKHIPTICSIDNTELKAKINMADVCIQQ